MGRNSVFAALAFIIVVLLLLETKRYWVPKLEKKPTHGASIATEKTGLSGKVRGDVLDSRRQPRPVNRFLPLESRFTSAISEHLRTIARSEVQQSNALLYSRYFATAHLSTRRAKLLQELLTDRMMAGLEPDIQSAGGGLNSLAMNDKMIAELIGEDGLVDLENARRDYLADQEAEDAIDAVFGPKGVQEDRRASIVSSLKGYSPNEGMGDLMAANTPMTPDVEAKLRADYQSRLSGTLRELRESLSPRELENFIKWSDTEFENSLNLLRAIQAPNSAK